MPEDKYGVEIGVGTGRFAVPLNIKVGVDPSPKLAEIARRKGITVYENSAEALPFSDSIFDFALMVTVICFVDDIEKAFEESYRILKRDGFLIVCFIDRNSHLGKEYQERKAESRFYKETKFYSVEELVSYLRKTGFSDFKFRQTIFDQRKDELQPVKESYGEGSFVVIKSAKK